MTRLEELCQQIEQLIAERDQELRRVRAACQHLRLVELDTKPPYRICADCGAEERGWYCGYQVLVMQGDSWERRVPHALERVLIQRTSDSSVFWKYRRSGPRYLVGQSHPVFGFGGTHTYEQLTEQPA